MVTVLLVDDQEMIRAGLRVILDAHEQISVVGEAPDGFAALEFLAAHSVDVVLMDLNMPGIGGVETTTRIRDTYGADGPRVLVLTTFDQDENVLAALRNGADGFLSKGAGPEELTRGIFGVAAGAPALSPTAISALVSHVVDESPAATPDPELASLFEQLTPRELETVLLVVEGLDNTEIGRRIYISPFTVKTHVNRAMMKVGARDRAQLIALAIHAGLVH